jgi:hypothetical protein
MAAQNTVTKEMAISELEGGASTKLSSDGLEELNDQRLTQFTLEEQKRIIHRVDRRLVLTLGFLYTVSLMDRTNLPNAIVAGMGVDVSFPASTRDGAVSHGDVVLVSSIRYEVYAD